MQDAHGRRIYWSWIREHRTKEATIAAGWAGVLSLPHILSLQANGSLSIWSVPEMRALRKARRVLSDVQVKSSETMFGKNMSGDSIEILAEFEPGEQRDFGLIVRSRSDGSQHTRIGYNRSKWQLYYDTRRSRRSSECEPGKPQGALPPTSGEPLTLNIFLDGSVIEIFANCRACLIERVYPRGSGALRIGSFSEGATARLKSSKYRTCSPFHPID